MTMYATQGYGLKSADGKFEKINFQRNECGPNDVEFDIIYCGVCHSDVHTAYNHLGDAFYPIVPGHELAGKVIKVGSNVTKYSIGDKVGVGCMVESCMKCHMCEKGDEQYCRDGATGTYSSKTKHGLIKTDTGYTFGGYSKRITVHQRFIIKIPHSYPLEYSGPIFCAGITMFSPLKHFGAGKGGKRVGIIGIGGLGQMGIRLAVALGNEVTAISTSPHKESLAKEIGAKHFVTSTNAESISKASKSLDLILNTVSAKHQVSHYLPMLDTNGTIVQLGLVTAPHEVQQGSLIFGRCSITGSLIGGIPETQECIDFCAEKNIKPEIEIITANRLDEVYELLNKKNDSVKRYVLDITKSF